MEINSKCKICKHKIEEHLWFDGSDCKCCFAGVVNWKPLFYNQGEIEK